MTSRTILIRCTTFVAVCLLTLVPSVVRAKDVPLELAPDKTGSGPRIIYLYPDYPATLDPQNGSSFANPLGLQFFDTLVSYEMDLNRMLADQTRVVPRLAESWAISPDKKLLTFKIR